MSMPKLRLVRGVQGVELLGGVAAQAHGRVEADAAERGVGDLAVGVALRATASTRRAGPPAASARPARRGVGSGLRGERQPRPRRRPARRRRPRRGWPRRSRRTVAVSSATAATASRSWAVASSSLPVVGGRAGIPTASGSAPVRRRRRERPWALRQRRWAGRPASGRLRCVGSHGGPAGASYDSVAGTAAGSARIVRARTSGAGSGSSRVCGSVGGRVRGGVGSRVGGGGRVRGELGRRRRPRRPGRRPR